MSSFTNLLSGIAQNMSLPAPSISNLSRRPQCATTTASRGRKLTCRVAAASSTCTSPQDVQQLWQLAGRKYGHDLSSKGRQKVETHLDSIQQGVQQLDLTGTSWKLAYTTSQGQSGGRVGPLIGYVTQIFPGDRKQQYVNRIQIGPLRADLLADYQYKSPERTDVQFVDVTLFLGGLKVLSKKFGSRSGGWWQMSEANERLRVLRSNQGNIFVLARTDEA